MSSRAFILAVALTTAAACGSGPTPPPPPPAAPTVSCPASISVESPDNVAMPVSFTVPTAAGGQAPVAVTCSAQPDATFPLGSTVVTCTATDALARTSTCNFNVAITPTPRISKTRFLAFGDSITYGRCGPGGRECPPYTTRLSELLSTRYQRQSLTMVRSGIPGEVASDDIAATYGFSTNGQDRVGPELQQYGSDVLLLMEGTNDLFFERAKGITPALQALGRMIDIARERNVTVFIATLPPQRLGGPRDEVARLIPGFNDQLRLMATDRGAHVVDVFGALAADIGRYISEDDLHPTADGLRVIGETFYAAIREKLDSTPSATSSLFTRR